jgi:hypothetical protein
MARKLKKLSQRDKFTIITNGKESEKNYFEAVRGAKRSIFDIAVEFDNADPISLVQRAMRKKQTSNQVWIVFDKDEFPSEAIYEAMKTARRNGIGVAFSNAAFEVWLIGHFREFSAEKTPDELLHILDSALKEYGYSKGYRKNDAELIKTELRPRLDKAVHNADVSLQKRIVEYKHGSSTEEGYPLCDWNSCTTVHKLVEALKLEDRN